MAKKRELYSPCSDRDIRSAVLRAAHERMRELDEKGIPTVGKMREIMQEESLKFRQYAEYMVSKSSCSKMTWEELKQACGKFAKKKTKGRLR
jgi:uncharacterized phage-like protein YoqJ